LLLIFYKTIEWITFAFELFTINNILQLKKWRFMSEPTSPTDLIEQLTLLNEKIIQYGTLIIGENKRLNEKIIILQKEIERLKSENASLSEGLLKFSEN